MDDDVEIGVEIGIAVIHRAVSDCGSHHQGLRVEGLLFLFGDQFERLASGLNLSEATVEAIRRHARERAKRGRAVAEGVFDRRKIRDRERAAAARAGA